MLATAALRYSGPRMRGLRDGSGAVLLVAALSALFYGVVLLRGRDYLACMILTFAGLSLLRAGIELLGPSPGG